ncbi:MAG: SH3 domain-containing protein [Caldilineaceae bacterium]|nr:SH3 domain-containing protein [Caldilineaceae bacterium]
MERFIDRLNNLSPESRRLLTLGVGLVVIGLLAIFLFVVAFQLGVNQGLSRAQTAVTTAEALRAAFAATSTATPTATPTNTPAPTFTPTATLTPTPTPATPAEWAQRYFDVALQGLGTLSLLDFSPTRAASLLQRLAQEQGMIFVPVSYTELSREPWAAFVSPRTPAGTPLPMLFWRSVGDERIQGQLLMDAVASVAGNGYTPLMAGLSHGVMRSDPLGRNHILMVERPEARPVLSAHLWSQPLPGTAFELTWRSDDDPVWAFSATDSQVTLEETEGGVLPDMVISSPLPADSPIRTQGGAAGVFIEQPPFARQRLISRWRPAFSEADAGPPATLTGYQLASAEVEPTPLASLAMLLALLQNGDVSRAQNYVTRIDILNEMFQLGLADPGDWMAVYVNDLDREMLDGGQSLRLRFFDNADRNRSFDVTFEEESEGGRYLIKTVGPVLLASTAGLVTPAPPRPTSTPTATATPLLAAETVVGVSGEITLTIPLSDVLGGDEAGILNPTLEPTPTATPTFTPTPTDTPTTTPTPSATPTPTDTPTFTPTPTATEKPLPIPTIAVDAVASQTGYMLLTDTARLRGGPGTDFIVIAALTNGTPVEIFGITEAGDWLLIRAAQVEDGRSGVVGWVAAQLVIPYGDYASVPLYRADGTSIDAPPDQPSALSILPTATPTPTPLVTPVIRQPSVAAPAAVSVPGPEPGEFSVTLGGASVPPDPLQPLPAVAADGRTLQLRVENAVVEVWGGVLNDPGAGWVPGTAVLLWPGTVAYITTSTAGEEEGTVAVSRVRIIGAPRVERTKVLHLDEIEDGVAEGTVLALLGSQAAPGVYLLGAGGRAQQLFQYEDRAAWLSGDPNAGYILGEPDTPGGVNTFSWMRNDGNGLQIIAQAYYSIQGVAGDAYGGLWWIETPNAALDRWQLWHFDPARGEIALRLQASGTIFGELSGQTGPSLTPILLAVQPETPGDPSRVTFFVDTADTALLQPYTGFFRLTVETDEAGRGRVVEGPLPLLESGQYRGPLVLSPDLVRLIYFAYDPAQPSLTAGTLKPSNMANMLTLSGRGASIIRTVYKTETRFEFLAPEAAWLGNDRLLLARARFAAGSDTSLDRFGIVQIQLPPVGDSPASEIQVNSYQLPRQQTLLAFAPCLDQGSVLLLTRAGDGTQQLARWEGQNQIFPLFGLPAALDRAFLCWKARL